MGNQQKEGLKDQSKEFGARKKSLHPIRVALPLALTQRQLTCHGQLEHAEVTAKLVAGRHHQLANVGAANPLQPQRVLVVVGHAHLVYTGLVG